MPWRPLIPESQSTTNILIAIFSVLRLFLALDRHADAKREFQVAERLVRYQLHLIESQLAANRDPSDRKLNLAQKETYEAQLEYLLRLKERLPTN